MSRQTITTPLSILVAGLIFVLLVMARPEDPSRAAPSRQDEDPYPAQTQTAQAEQTANGSAYPGQATETATVTGTRTATPTRTQTSAQRTPTGTATRATPTPTVARQPTQSGAVTSQPADDATTFPQDNGETPTPTNELTCAPGQRVDIAGSGPPRTGFLLYFNGRPVSGGTTGADGSFSISLVVGAEAAGTYDVVVKVRGSSQALRELTCSVPVTTPTPLPGRR